MTAGAWLYKTPEESVSPSELRYSIRAACRYLGVDQVCIIGDLPDWAANVAHVPGGPDSGAKYRNLFEDLRRACASSELPASFLLMNDDFHALRPFVPALEHGGPLLERLEGIERMGRPPGPFGNAFAATLEWLSAVGLSEPLTYELHRPLPMRRDCVRAALEAACGHPEPLHARTVYGALWEIGGARAEDTKLTGLPAAEGWRSLDLVSTYESGWQGAPGRWLREQSPEPSPFEKG